MELEFKTRCTLRKSMRGMSLKFSYNVLIFSVFFRETIQFEKVDISELTWEQKERVLRLLFAKMNGRNQW